MARWWIDRLILLRGCPDNFFLKDDVLISRPFRRFGLLHLFQCGTIVLEVPDILVSGENSPHRHLRQTDCALLVYCRRINTCLDHAALPSDVLEYSTWNACRLPEKVTAPL